MTKLPSLGETNATSQHATLATISSAIGNLATDHGKLLGIYNGFDPLRNCGWVILSTRLRLLRPVGVDADVKIETWVASIEGGQLIREYRISKDSETLVEAAHAFVLFDRTTRRIVIPPRKSRDELGGRASEFNFAIELSRRPRLPVFSPKDHVSTFVVTKNDIDHNQHLNNSVYLRWTESHLQSRKPSPIHFAPFEFGIEFLTEAGIHDTIQVRSPEQDALTYFLSNESKPSIFAVSQSKDL